MTLPQVQLSPFRREDAVMLSLWLSDPCTLTMTAPDWLHPVTPASIIRDYFDRAYGAEVYRVTHEGTMVGHLGLRVMHGTTGHLFHIIVDPQKQRLGFGSALMQETIQVAFLEQRLRRLQFYVFDENSKAIHCYLRAGFRIEGHHREHFFCDGRWLNTYSMALLRTDWELNAGHNLPMRLTTVDSSLIHAFGYDVEQQVLEIVFVNGRIHRYLSVPPDEFEGLQLSASKGRYYLDNIKDIYFCEQLRGGSVGL